MPIDLNKPFSTADVSALLSSKDDTAHRQLRVTSQGLAYLSDEVGADNISGLAFRLETWIAGNGYVGNSAASDVSFVASIESVLRNNWPNPTSSYIEFYR
jgi:hypothetical protein